MIQRPIGQVCMEVGFDEGSALMIHFVHQCLSFGFSATLPAGDLARNLQDKANGSVIAMAN